MGPAGHLAAPPPPGSQLPSETGDGRGLGV